MMQPAKRVFLNTIAQYIRAAVNIFLALFSTRFVLEALGKSDYGTYSVVASVVAMLGFLTNALVVTTQRHLSFYQGNGKLDFVKQIFSNSLFLHLVIAVAICAILASLTHPIINDWLIIESSRLEIAKYILWLTILMLFCSIMTSPFKATLVARENIVYISIIEMCDGILKFGFSVWLLYIDGDKLLIYGLVMALIQVFQLVAISAFGLIKYPECSLIIHRKDISKKCINLIFNFAGWTLYSAGCIIGRNQGMSVVFNRFFGTAINASYGIAMQVAGNVQFLAQAILNAMSPQIVKTESGKDRQSMLRMAEVASKYSFLMIAMIGIPIIFEMPEILRIWLKDVPDYAIVFCRFILLASICDQITIGLGTANQAIGDIRNYSLVINTIKLITILVSSLLLYCGYSVTVVMWSYLIIECICAIARLPFLKCTAGLSIRQYTKNVMIPIIPSIIVLVITGYIMTNYIDCPLRFIYTFLVSVIANVVALWFFVLKNNEKLLISQLCKKALKKS